MSRIGRYTVKGKLGQGGMGVVYEVQDPDMPRSLALKLIIDQSASETAVERFWREAEALGRIRHRSVVRVHQIGQVPEGTFLAMEKVEGTPLDEVCSQGPLEPSQAAHIARELADAIEAVHAAEVLHRDIKPANVILQPDGIPVLLDFGLVRDQSAEKLTKTGTSLGTLLYMSPEQIGGFSTSLLGPQTDVYSLGVVLFEMLTRSRPFEGAATELIGQVLHVAPPRPSSRVPHVPRELDAICLKCLAKDAQDRYATAAELREDLDRFLSGRAPLALQAGSRRTKRMMVGASALLLLLAAGLGAVLVAKRRAGDRLSPEQLEAQRAKLEPSLRTLLTREAPLRSDADEIAAIVAEVRGLRERAQAESGRFTRTARRARALQGLLCLAEGKLALAAAAAADLEGSPLPAAMALRGGLAAVTTKSDAAQAVQDLSRAIGRGIVRSDLRSWRARAQVRAGLDGKTSAEQVLADLAAVGRVRGAELTRAERDLQVWALLAAGQTDKAQEALSKASGGPKLKWAIALAQVDRLLSDSPREALQKLAGLPQTEVTPLRAKLAKRAVKHTEPLQEKIRVRKLLVKQADETLLLTLCKLARRLDPRTPLPHPLLEALFAHGNFMGGQVNHPVMHALIDLAGNDFEIQRQISYLVQVRAQGFGQRRKLLPALRSAIANAPNPKERLAMQLGLCFTLAEIDEAKECIALASRILPGLEGRDRAEALAYRSYARYHQKDYEEAHQDITEALAIKGGGRWSKSFGFYRMCIVDALGKKREALEAGVESLRGSVVEWKQDRALLRVWPLARELKAYALGAEGVQNVLGYRLEYSGGWWVRLAWLEVQLGRLKQAAKSLKRGGDRLLSAKKRFRRFGPRAAALSKRVAREGTAALPQLEALVAELEQLRGDKRDP